MRTVRTYQSDYTIGCDDTSKLYYCLKAGVAMLKKDKKPAAYKNLTLAEKFIIAAGAQEIPVAPKKTEWTMPEAVIIAPLQEQLVQFPDDRFVLIEIAYGYYNEHLGYAVYDRETSEIADNQTHCRTYNEAIVDREDAVAELAYQKEHGPAPKIEVDMGIFNLLAEAEERYENRFAEPLPEPEVVPVAEDEIAITSQEKVGSIIEYRGDKWLVKECNYISEKEAAEMEEDFDIFLSSGWHSSLVRVSSESEAKQ